MHPKSLLRIRFGLLRIAVAFLVSAALCIGITTDAYAYVDPGSGALLWQALLAAFFGATFYARTIVRYVKGWLNARKKSGKEEK